MKVVILCGGRGTRLNEQTEFKPKPLLRIGEMPILWHIMKIYSHFGFKDFILCLGYKGHEIKSFFMSYDYLKHDFTFNLADRKSAHMYHNDNPLEDWNITFAETGLDTNTGGRIKKIKRYMNEDNFLMTYGDGVADINIDELKRYHFKHNKIATITTIQPTSRFGIVEFDKNGIVSSFKEKPKLDGWINGGFCIFKNDIFDYINGNEILEQRPLKRLAKDRQLTAFQHKGFWECMDTHRDWEHLNSIWQTGNAFWKIWKN